MKLAKKVQRAGGAGRGGGGPSARPGGGRGGGGGSSSRAGTSGGGGGGGAGGSSRGGGGGGGGGSSAPPPDPNAGRGNATPKQKELVSRIQRTKAGGTQTRDVRSTPMGAYDILSTHMYARATSPHSHS